MKFVKHITPKARKKLRGMSIKVRSKITEYDVYHIDVDEIPFSRNGTMFVEHNNTLMLLEEKQDMNFQEVTQHLLALQKGVMQLHDNGIIGLCNYNNILSELLEVGRYIDDLKRSTE